MCLRQDIRDFIDQDSYQLPTNILGNSGNTCLSVSWGLRLAPPPRVVSVVVLAQVCVCVCVPTCFVVEGVVLRCSCIIMFLRPHPGRFWFSRFCVSSLQNKQPELLLNLINQKMFLGPELHGGPSAPKMLPGSKIKRHEVGLYRPLFLDSSRGISCR